MITHIIFQGTSFIDVYALYTAVATNPVFVGGEHSNSCVSLCMYVYIHKSTIV